MSLAAFTNEQTALHPQSLNYTQALNSYVEQVARGITPRSTSVEFWVKDGEEHLSRIDAQLPSTGSLGPLFFAFGLISQEELQAGTGGQHERVVVLCCGHWGCGGVVVGCGDAV